MNETKDVDLGNSVPEAISSNDPPQENSAKASSRPRRAAPRATTANKEDGEVSPNLKAKRPIKSKENVATQNVDQGGEVPKEKVADEKGVGEKNIRPKKVAAAKDEKAPLRGSRRPSPAQRMEKPLEEPALEGVGEGAREGVEEAQKELPQQALNHSAQPESAQPASGRPASGRSASGRSASGRGRTSRDGKSGAAHGERAGFAATRMEAGEGASKEEKTLVGHDKVEVVADDNSPLTNFNLHKEATLWPEAWADDVATFAQKEQGKEMESGFEPREGEDRGNENIEASGPLSAGLSNEGVKEESVDIPATPAILAEPAKKQEKRGREARSSSPERSRNEKARGGKEVEEESSEDSPKGKAIMYISVLPGEQIEVAIAKDGRLQEYYVQMLHQASTRSNIYKGVIHNIDANLQAAFISYGANKNGFLQIDEVHPEYYLAPHDTSRGKKYPLIQKVLKAGQEVLVQVIKEPTAGKGAFLSTYLSLPGRFMVLTPGRPQLGISRKVEDEDDRERLRELLKSLPVTNELGIIVRTASLNASKTTMLKDLQFLKRLWKEVRTKGATEPAPSLVYEEPGLASRAIRDYLSDDIKEVWVDDEATSKEIGDIVSLVFPRRSSQNIIKLHSDASKSMWSTFNLQQQIDQVYSREVPLPSGGRIAFDQTEALMAIDINSGRIGGRSNFESMALRTNMEAAEAIAEQLRLRDIGGQIVIDFIEMRERNHWRDLEKVMRAAMKNDRARYDVAKVSPFGLMEVVRQRLASSAISITMEHCPCCEGTGLRRNMEWQALRALRELQAMLKADRDTTQTVIPYEAEKELALYLLNKKRNGLAALEQQFSVEIEIKAVS